MPRVIARTNVRRTARQQEERGGVSTVQLREAGGSGGGTRSTLEEDQKRPQRGYFDQSRLLGTLKSTPLPSFQWW